MAARETPYQLYIKPELLKIKREHPDMPHSEAFRLATQIGSQKWEESPQHPKNRDRAAPARATSAKRPAPEADEERAQGSSSGAGGADASGGARGAESREANNSNGRARTVNSSNSNGNASLQPPAQRHRPEPAQTPMPVAPHFAVNVTDAPLSPTAAAVPLSLGHSPLAVLTSPLANAITFAPSAVDLNLTGGLPEHTDSPVHTDHAAVGVSHDVASDFHVTAEWDPHEAWDLELDVLH